MEKEIAKMDNSSGINNHAGPSSAAANTNFTSETLCLELTEGERVNHVSEFPINQANLLAANQAQKKKATSFKITSVVNTDTGEESPDDTEDMSDNVDSSKMTSEMEQETPSLSEEYSKSEDFVNGPSVTVISTSSQYGITAVVQQNEAGGLLTSRLPQGITVNVTKGGIAIAEAEGVPVNETENLSNRFKIVKIASNKPFKKGRWVCFDFMDSPTSSALGSRNTDASHGHGVSIPIASNYIAAGGHQLKALPKLQQQVQQFSMTSQGGNVPQTTVTFASQMPTQVYHSNVSNQNVNMASHTQQVPQMTAHHQQLQHQMHQQQQLQMQQQSQSSSVIPSQNIDNKQTGAIGPQTTMTSAISSSTMNQNIASNNIIPSSQPTQDNRAQQSSLMHTQPMPAGHIPSNQQIGQQQPPMQQYQQQQSIQQTSNQQQPASVPQSSNSTQQKKMIPNQAPSQQHQPQQQQPATHMQHSLSQQQQQMQHQVHQQLQQQTSIPAQQQSLPPSGSDQTPMQTDQQGSSSQTVGANYSVAASQSQQQQGSVPPQQLQPQHSSPQIQPQQQQVQPQQQGQQQSSPSGAGTPQSSVLSSTPNNALSSNYSSSVVPNIGNLSNINISNMISSQINAASISQLVQAQTATDAVVGEGADQQTNAATASEDGSAPPRDDENPSASSVSTVAIDNKIEQAMDLVKSHLMFAVREEVDVLKERIGELMERINHLEYENTVLRKYATPETLQQLQHHNPNP